MFRYRFQGVQVDSDIDLGLIQKKYPRPLPERSVKIITKSPLKNKLGSPDWESPFYSSGGTGHLGIHALEGYPLIEITAIGTFHIFPDRIEARPEPGADVVPFLLGRVLALWLQLSGVHILHGSCLTHRVGSIGILGHSGAGKSTLATALVEGGWQMVTDDLIPLEQIDVRGALVHPGIPFSRLWPDSGQYFFPDFDSFDRVQTTHEKRKVTARSDGSPRFSDESCFLGQLIILRRGSSEADIEFEPVSGAPALTTLLAASYRPEPLQHLGLHPSLLASLAEVVAHVPITVLHYPCGFDRLDEVCRAIEGFVSDQEVDRGRKVGDLLVGTDR